MNKHTFCPDGRIIISYTGYSFQVPASYIRRDIQLTMLQWLAYLAQLESTNNLKSNLYVCRNL